jgi:hypothetical protein
MGNSVALADFLPAPHGDYRIVRRAIGPTLTACGSPGHARWHDSRVAPGSSWIGHHLLCELDGPPTAGEAIPILSACAGTYMRGSTRRHPQPA